MWNKLRINYAVESACCSMNGWYYEVLEFCFSSLFITTVKIIELNCELLYDSNNKDMLD